VRRPHFLTRADFSQDDGGQFWVIPVKDRRGNYLVVPEVGWLKSKGTKSDKPKKKYVRVRAVWMKQSGKNFKVILLEEIRFGNGVHELRFCYWTITGMKNKRWKGVWWWGQSALMVPRGDIEKILRFAARKGMISIGAQPKRSE
jgi:hypothetical protein